MAFYDIGVVSQLSASISWTRTSASPSSGSETLDYLDSSNYGGYVKRYGGGSTIPVISVASTNDGGGITAPSKNGYVFDGWFSYSGDRAFGSGGYTLNDATVRLSSNQTITYPTVFSQAGTLTWSGGRTTYYMIYAKWRPRSVVILFDTNGGQMPVGTNYFIRATYLSPYGTLPTPTRSGYTFAGWYTAATGGTRVSASTTVTNPDDHTLYAHWTAVAANVTLYFDAAGGTVSPTSRQVTEGQAYGALPTPTRSGYTFAGWYTRATGGDAATAQTVAGDEDVTIYAHWTGESLTITFNANGGTVSEASRTVVRGSQYKRLPIPVRDGYNFDGWYTAATGGTQVTAGDYPSASTTLYAHWSNGTVPWLVVTTW